MAFKIRGIVSKTGQPRQGVGARGEWKAVDFMLETIEQYPRHPVFSLYGIDNVDHFLERCGIGTEVIVSFDVDGRQWQDKMFPEIRAYNVITAQEDIKATKETAAKSVATEWLPEKPTETAPTAQPQIDGQQWQQTASAPRQQWQTSQTEGSIFDTPF